MAAPPLRTNTGSSFSSRAWSSIAATTMNEIHRWTRPGAIPCSRASLPSRGGCSGMTPDRKPPFNVQVLQRWVGELAREQGIAPGRVQRWISFMVVAAMLDHARDENEDPVFVLKGGAAMELRLGLRARATKDYDTAYREAIEGMLERLDEALRHGFGDFL